MHLVADPTPRRAVDVDQAGAAGVGPRLLDVQLGRVDDLAVEGRIDAAEMEEGPGHVGPAVVGAGPQLGGAGVVGRDARHHEGVVGAGGDGCRRIEIDRKLAGRVVDPGAVGVDFESDARLAVGDEGVVDVVGDGGIARAGVDLGVGHEPMWGAGPHGADLVPVDDVAQLIDGGGEALEVEGEHEAVGGRRRGQDQVLLEPARSGGQA